MELREVLNLNMYASEYHEEKEEEEPWQIKNDGEADWWIEVNNEDLKREERLLEAIEEKIIFYQRQKIQTEKNISYIKGKRDGKLLNYFRIIPEEEKKITKTQEKYSLPTGDLILKKPREKYEKDDEDLVEWLKKHKLDEYIKVKESPDWAEFKKNTRTIGDKLFYVNPETGEMSEIDGVEVKQTLPEFLVKDK